MHLSHGILTWPRERLEVDARLGGPASPNETECISCDTFSPSRSLKTAISVVCSSCVSAMWKFPATLLTTIWPSKWQPSPTCLENEGKTNG
eukprot:scaffold99618_cov39-Tisochrysis_lutea.AAC.3